MGSWSGGVRERANSRVQSSDFQDFCFQNLPTGILLTLESKGLGVAGIFSHNDDQFSLTLYVLQPLPTQD